MVIDKVVSSIDINSNYKADPIKKVGFDTVFENILESYKVDNTTDTVNNISTLSSGISYDLNNIFERAANTYNVSVDLLKAIAKAESEFDIYAVSKAGAQGIMQLMPYTAKELGVTNSFDPLQNIMGGAKYISQLLEKYNGNVTLALAAYNAGSNNVDKYGGVPPFEETQNYVKKIIGFLQQGGVTVPNKTVTDTSSYNNINQTNVDNISQGDNVHSALIGNMNDIDEDILIDGYALSGENSDTYNNDNISAEDVLKALNSAANNTLSLSTLNVLANVLSNSNNNSSNNMLSTLALQTNNYNPITKLRGI